MTADLNTNFDNIINLVTKLKSPATNKEQLTLYGLYKQVKFGDNTTTQPNKLFNLNGYWKWYAWNTFKGKTENDCKEGYIKLANELIEKHGVSS